MQNVYMGMHARFTGQQKRSDVFEMQSAEHGEQLGIVGIVINKLHKDIK